METSKRKKNTGKSGAGRNLQVQAIPVGEIVVPKVRVTAFYDDDTLALLKKSLETAGTINPIIVVKTPEAYEVVDGLHRWQEACARGEQTINAVVYEGGADDSMLLNLILNKLRGKTKASEMVRVIGSLYKDHGYGPDDIQEKTGLSRDYIERLMQISTASPVVQEALDQEIIGVGHAYQISRLPHPMQQDEIIAKHQVWRFTVKELTEQIDAVLVAMDELRNAPAPTATQEPAPPRTYYCEGCKDETDPRYLRPVMICPECFSALWRLGKNRPAPEADPLQETGGV